MINNYIKTMVGLCILSLFWFSCQSSSQPPKKEYLPYYYVDSEIKIDSVDNNIIENLVVICKVWGFVKYHHPVFCDTSSYNIDFELFDLLSEATNKDKTERNTILAKWIDSFGKFKSVPKEYASLLDTLEVQEISDCTWIGEKTILESKLSSRLQKLRYAERGDNLHMTMNDDIAYTEIQKFDTAPYLNNRSTIDCGYRLLSLFKFWNIVEYFNPNKKVMDNDWDSILQKYIPLFINAGKASYLQTLAKLIAEIDDTHAFYFFPSIFGDYFLPFQCRFAENKLVVTRLAGENLPIKIGDQILSIDNSTPEDIRRLVREYISNSNEASELRNAAWYAAKTQRDTVSISYMRNSQIYRTTVSSINYAPPYFPEKEIFTSINDSVGYVYPARQFFDKAEATGLNLKQKINEKKYIILDHRCYPYLSSFHIVPDILIDRRGELLKMTHPIIKLPGLFMVAPFIEGSDNPQAFKGKIIVLVNEDTQSMAEFVTMILQNMPQTIVIGSQTAGADGTAARILLPGDVEFSISGLGVYYSDGTPTQRVGVKIDHYVAPTVKGIREGRDEVLERAIEIASKRGIID